MTCSRVRKLASAYLDHELAGSESLAVRAHLADCPVCAAEVEQTAAVCRQLAALSPVDPSKELPVRLRSAIASETRRRKTSNWAFGGALAAAAAAGAIGAVWLYRASGSEAESPASRTVAVEGAVDQTYVASTDPFGSPVPVIPANLGGN
ncbi:MAG: zf-HC2 domain-containing protein [Fimbriimonadaceae bacterium]|nr:zf-HC2 domain-containing protein [Fimbriimonadaceae bacterium]QYK56261.1 MAG: zf-HC2 domain-containing protein [Fimbriimonadaceae bacterium]